MEKKTSIPKSDRMNSILLKGKIFEHTPGESLVLEADGAILTVNYKDIREVRPTGEEEAIKEVLVAPGAKITFETLLTPTEVSGILSKEAVIELVRGSMINRYVECSRCSGGECECSRCVEAGLANRCVECSRCTGGECECSRCVERVGNPAERSAGTFRRRLA